MSEKIDITKASPLKGNWALVLGCSSGYGAGIAKALAGAGMNILGVHLDRKTTLPDVEKVKSEIEALGVKVKFWNANAADPELIATATDEIKSLLSGAEKVRVLIHALAFGTLKPFIKTAPENQITKVQLEMTLDVMANSLIYWTQACYNKTLFGNGTRIYGLTSSGTDRTWPDYGAVSAAKAVLECHMHTLSLELGPQGITANSLLLGVADTPAQRKIPGSDRMQEKAKSINPHQRLTTPEDVGRALVCLAQPETYWISGNRIGIDGGEYYVA